MGIKVKFLEHLGTVETLFIFCSRSLRTIAAKTVSDAAKERGAKDGDMRFTKLTDAEQAEFMELIKDSFDPEFYSEDDLPSLRASKKRWEDEQRRGEATPVPDERCEPLDEDLEPAGDSSDPWRWEHE